MPPNISVTIEKTIFLIFFKPYYVSGATSNTLPHPVEQIKKEAWCRTLFLYGGRRNYLVMRRCNKPTLNSVSHYTDSALLWNFLRSHTQNEHNAS